MILVDLNQVLISNLMAQVRGKGDVKPNKEMIRHMVLTSLRGFNAKFGQEYGQMVLCSDASDPWRKDFFPNYKHSRKQARLDGPFDWDNIFKIITEIKHEVAKNFPYIVMYVENSEADDIIATLIKLQEDDIYLVVSGDKDFIQLHQSDNVKQYSPTLKKFIVDENPEQYKFEHIIRGDKGDGVPNVLSQDTVFVEDLRQRPITKKKLTEWKENGIPEGEIKRNYQRNKTLIDFDSIPNELGELIYNMWVDKITQNDKSKILPYFMKHRLKELTEKLGDF